jgi:MFS family permease
MSYLLFVRDNARWITSGFLLFFFSAFGQTYFISLFAGEIRSEYGLSHGSFGWLYMVATLLSAVSLTKLGQIVDQYSARKVTGIVTSALACASVMMAITHHVVALFVTIYLLRLFGQGMMTHTAFTLMGRWFSTERGRAVSTATLGMNTAEALFPVAFVALVRWVDWRNAWWLAAAVLLVAALPLITTLVSVERDTQDAKIPARQARTRDWTRGEVLRDAVFYIVLLATIPPAFIGNTIFFHQVYLIDMRGWSQEAFASSFTFYAAMTVVFVVVSGQLVDRFSALRLFPFYAVPLGLGCVLLGTVEWQWTSFAFMALYGITNGFSLTLLGSLWPEIYGLRHLGSIRAAIVAVLVFASALGPGVAGMLIDLGVDYSDQITALGVYCLLVPILAWGARGQVEKRSARRRIG